MFSHGRAFLKKQGIPTCQSCHAESSPNFKTRKFSAFSQPTFAFSTMGLPLFLFFLRCLKSPETTVIGLENHFKKAWVERMMRIEAKDRGLSLTTINNTITASTFLATTSLALSSLIGTWLADSSQQSLIKNSLIYGNTSSSIGSVKYITLLICFLVAFGSFLQCVRNFVHASFLISMPNADIPVSYAQKAVIRGGACWSVGLRAIYYATVLLFWVFGPIPMFIASLVMVLVLHLLDRNVTPLHQFEEAKLIS